MSDNPMGGFGSVPAEPPQLPMPPEETPSTGPDRKVVIGGGIALAALALAGGYHFLGGGGSSTPTTALPKRVTHTVTPTPVASALLVKPTPAVRTFNGDVGRDPFKALVTASPTPPPTTPPAAKPPAAAPAAPSPAAPSPAAPVPPAPVGPGGVVGVVPSPGTVLPTSVGPLPTAPTGPTSSAKPTVAPTSSAHAVMVVLKAIAFPKTGATTVPYVDVVFGGKSYVVKTGETVAGSLKVIAIAPDDGTATFQLGDQTFDLHIGQSYVD